MKPFGGTISNWKQVPAHKKGETVIVGVPNKDNRFFGYPMIRTSIVVSINAERTEAETLNTIYKLESETKGGAA